MPVRVTFLTWTFEGSLALIVFVSLIVGALISVLMSVPSFLKSRSATNRLRKEIAALTAEIDTVRRQSYATRADGSRITRDEAKPPTMNSGAR